MSPFGEPRDERRDSFFKVVSALSIGNLASIVWLGTAERGLLDSGLIWLAAFVAASVAWNAFIAYRVPQPSSQKRPGNMEPDRFLGIVIGVWLGGFGLTWQTWLPGIGSSGSLPLSAVPESVHALRIGLTMILASSMTVVVWVVLRLLFPARERPDLESADVRPTERPA